MLSIFSSWAVIPLAALYKARIISPSSVVSRDHARHFFYGAPIEFIAEVHRLLQHFELAHEGDQANRRLGRSDVRLFDLSLQDRSRRVRGRRTLGGREIVHTLFFEAAAI